MDVDTLDSLELWAVGFAFSELVAPGLNVLVEVGAGVPNAHLPWHLAAAIPS